MQLVVSLIDAVLVVRVHHEDQALGALVVVPPERADLVLAADVPRRELDILVLDGLDSKMYEDGELCEQLPLSHVDDDPASNVPHISHISSLSPAASSYESRPIQIGTPVFTDRDYTWFQDEDSTPAELLGLDFVYTPMNDKVSDCGPLCTNWLCFDVSSDGTLYIIADDRWPALQRGWKPCHHVHMENKYISTSPSCWVSCRTPCDRLL